MVRILLNGRNTNTCSFSENGVFQTKITQLGRGKYFQQEYSTIEEAEAFCSKELKINRTAIFYVMDGDYVVRTVLDAKFLTERDRRFKLISHIVALVIYSSLGWWISFGFYSGLSIYPHVAFALIVGALYAMHWRFGLNVIEASVNMAVIVILLGVAASAFHR